MKFGQTVLEKNLKEHLQQHALEDVRMKYLVVIGLEGVYSRH